MTKLLCDLGNSRLKWALWDGKLFGCGSGAYEGDGGFADGLIALPRPDAIAAISVAGRHNLAFQAFCQARWGLVPTWHGVRREGFGVRSLYEPPETLGVDRFAALVGARARFGACVVCVVDCGTAITVDALDQDGVFQGGAILPGVTTAGAALRRAADTLPVMDLAGEAVALGRSTVSAMKAGLLLGTAGAIDRIVQEQTKALSVVALVVLTGGDAQKLGAYLSCPHEVVPYLTLEGLAVMAA